MIAKGFPRFINSQKLFIPQEQVLLAVSGGIDSTVMAHLFHQAKFQFAIAHCNFGLRGNNSAEDAEFVKNLADQFKVPFFVQQFETTNFASQKGISIQMAARDLRYDWFEKIRQENQFSYIATAHHLDDQIETFLINLIRGTGIAGLHGIPVKNGKVIRPLMFAFRKDIEEFARLHQIVYRTDSSNDETKYLRNKIRHKIIPLLGSIKPDFQIGFTETIKRIHDFEQLGNHAISNWCVDNLISNGNEKFIDIDRFLKAVPIGPYAWGLLSPYGFNETQVSDLLTCLDKKNRKIFHSSTHRLVKDRGRLILSLIEPKGTENVVNIELFSRKKKITKPKTLSFERIDEVKTYQISSSANIANLDFDKLHFPLILRKWQAGDSFFPLGMMKKKKLSDFFIDQKFSMSEKEQIWLLCSANNIAWVIGHRIDHRYRVTTATQKILKVVTRDK
ncbi:MAG: tRNA lysidine(34) synthetase TilS [Bacteroidetes bacterium]|nr:tRNA lysidine(34) synthetase TilS [Bacteroidota bacterium]